MSGRLMRFRVTCSLSAQRPLRVCFRGEQRRLDECSRLRIAGVSSESRSCLLRQLGVPLTSTSSCAQDDAWACAIASECHLYEDQRLDRFLSTRLVSRTASPHCSPNRPLTASINVPATVAARMANRARTDRHVEEETYFSYFSVGQGSVLFEPSG